jgi:hypothetical protein
MVNDLVVELLNTCNIVDVDVFVIDDDDDNESTEDL